jgi:hypothetical protein
MHKERRVSPLVFRIAATKGRVRAAYSPLQSGHCLNSFYFRLADGYGAVQASDVKDLDVVVAQAVGQKATLRGAHLRKQVPKQDDPGRVDVVYPPKL